MIGIRILSSTDRESGILLRFWETAHVPLPLANTLP